MKSYPKPRTRRRSPGEGSVYPAKDGRWRGAIRRPLWPSLSPLSATSWQPRAALPRTRLTASSALTRPPGRLASADPPCTTCTQRGEQRRDEMSAVEHPRAAPTVRAVRDFLNHHPVLDDAEPPRAPGG